MRKAQRAFALCFYCFVSQVLPRSIRGTSAGRRRRHVSTRVRGRTGVACHPLKQIPRPHVRTRARMRPPTRATAHVDILTGQEVRDRLWGSACDGDPHVALEHENPSSTAHMELHPSPSPMLPSSHRSPPAIIPGTLVLGPETSNLRPGTKGQIASSSCCRRASARMTRIGCSTRIGRSTGILLLPLSRVVEEQ
jgi:hypothetical protein